MTPAPPAPEAAPEAAAMGRIAALLERRTGIRVQPAQRARLARAVARRAAELGESGATAYALRAEREPEEWRRLVPDVVVGETHFLRDRQRWTAIEDHVLPALVESGRRQPLRLWSAGCATGQEAYGLGMVAERLRDRLPGLAVEVVGSDLNPQALEVARRGVYPSWAMRGLERHEVARFFEPCREGHRVRPALRERVRFEDLNLAQWAEAGPWPARFDLILCQHVLIYLSPRRVEGVLRALARSLKRGGMLMVGHSETMTPPDGCVLEWVGDSSGFRKPLPGMGLAEFPASSGRPPRPAEAGPDLDGVLAAAWDDVAAERYDAARERLRGVSLTGEALRLAAWIAVCGGEPDTARTLSARALAEDPDDAESHLVAGILAAGTGRSEEAVRLLKRAVYLDPRLSVAYFHLAELEAARGHWENARRFWRNAARASAADARRVRRFAGGFDVGAFAEACDGRRAADGGWMT